MEITILIAILVFGMLIILHELGHFVAAKRAGIQVNEFWIGMGPAIFRKRYRGTDYCLRILPIGGAVVMEGEDGESDHPGSFARAPLWRRIVVVTAGPLMNLLIGFVIVFCLFLPTERSTTTQLAGFAEGFDTQGLQVGDTIVEIDDYSIYLNSDVLYALSRGDGEYDIVVKRDGEKIRLDDVDLTPKVFEGETQARYGLTFTQREATVLTKLHDSFFTSVDYARMIWISLGDLVSGDVGLDQLSGPVGVSVALGETARQSLLSMWMLVAFISINLGIMNILPLPALDGGRLLFLLLELVRGKPVPPKYEGLVHGAGLALLMLLMVYVTFQDIIRVVTG